MTLVARVSLRDTHQSTTIKLLTGENGLTSITAHQAYQFTRDFIQQNIARIDTSGLPSDAAGQANALFNRVAQFADMRSAQAAQGYNWGVKSGNSVLTVAARFLCAAKETHDIAGIRQSMLDIAGADQASMGATHACLATMDRAFLDPLVRSTPRIAKDYTGITSYDEQRQAHEQSKRFLETHLPSTGASVEFVSSPGGSCPTHESVTIGTDIDSSIFSWEITTGVEKDIQADGRRVADNLVIYGVASQFNGSEAPDSYTVVPGQAKKTYAGDKTQGPLAQLQFPAPQVEMINCGANLGFNGLCPALDEFTKDAVSHGYLRPKTSVQADALIDRLKDHGHKVEYTCVNNTPTESVGLSGAKPVYQLMSSAPAFGQYDKYGHNVTSSQQQEIQFLCALHSYRAQFHHAVTLAKTHNKPVVLKPAAVGLGVFGNDYRIIAKAFYTAAVEQQNMLRDNNVSVR